MKPLQENEAQFVKAAIARHRGNMTAAARELQISRETLYRKAWRYRLIHTRRPSTSPRPSPHAAHAERETEP